MVLTVTYFKTSDGRKYRPTKAHPNLIGTTRSDSAHTAGKLGLYASALVGFETSSASHSRMFELLRVRVKRRRGRTCRSVPNRREGYTLRKHFEACGVSLSSPLDY